ncbi:MAG: histidine kinase [Raineya sp.]|jgi:signal transduction histidine kinase|nr:histidine kinase [Raineya sp.]
MYKFYIKVLFFLFIYSSICIAQEPVFKYYDRGNGLASDYINAIFQDSKGFVWISSDKGVSRYDGKDFLHFNTDNGLAANMVYNIWEDSQGLIWFEIYEKNLCFWDGHQMRISNIQKMDYSVFKSSLRGLHVKEVKKHPIAYFVEELDSTKRIEIGTLTDYEGNEWASIFGKGVYRFVPYLKNWQTDDEIVNFYKDTQNQIYLVGRKAVYIFQYNKLVQKINVADIRAIAQDQKNQFWVGGLYDWVVTQKLTDFSNKKNCAGISDIIIENKKVWMSTFGSGIIVKNDLQIDTLNTKNGLVSNTIERLIQTPSYFWATTYGNGVSRINQNMEIVNFNQTIGMLSNIAYCVYEENKKTFWIASEGGISIFENQKLIQNIKTPEKILAITNYNQVFYAISEKNLYKIQNYGLKKIGAIYLLPPNTQAGINRVFTEKNLIYIAHTQGLSVLDLEKIIINTSKPQIQILEIKSKKHTFNTDRVALKHDDNFLRIKVATLSFLNENENKISYRIKDENSEWSEPKNLKEITLTDLSYERHILEIKVLNANGLESDVVSIPIEVIAPFWRETWFLVLIILLSLGAFTFLVRYISYRRLRNKLRTLELQQKIQQERERIARDLHDNVGSQLTYIIANLEDTAESLTEKPKNQLEELSDFTRQTINQLRETIWAINQPAITLESFESKVRDLIWNYTKRFKEPKITVQIHLDQDRKLNSVQALNLYRIIQETLNNAFKHSKAQEIVVKLQTIHNHFKMSIKDNGVGFDKSNPDNFRNYGLLSFETRAKEIEANLKIETSLQKGVEIILEMKLD